MENLGKANVQVEISDGLPGINKEPTKYNFDVTAWNWRNIQNSPFFYPLLTEQISDGDEQFAALYPSRRKFYVDNYLTGTDTLKAVRASESTLPLPYIVFTPVAADTSGDRTPLVTQFLDSEDFDEYKLLQPDEYTDAKLEDYKGPIWRQALVSKILPPNDSATIKDWYKKMDIPVPAITPSDTVEKTLNYTNQSVVRDGLYWGIQSSAFLRENMPIWVTLKVASPPPTGKHNTFFVISIGIDSTTQAYDILLELNSKASIIDYYRGRDARSSGGKVPYWRKEFDSDLAKVLDSQKEIEIGIMTIGGRLVVWVNQVPLVYTRMNRDSSSGDDSGTLLDAKIDRKSHV